LFSRFKEFGTHFYLFFVVWLTLIQPALQSVLTFILTVGQTANYAVVVAQLHTKGVCHGIHPFIVQLRDEETHKPMPGICIQESRCID
jgi:acyl-CoA oxidase